MNFKVYSYLNWIGYVFFKKGKSSQSLKIVTFLKKIVWEW